jgi:hypothetical protein
MATLPGPTLVVTNYFADTLSRLAVQLDYLKEYWFIPLCMAILWLYGRYHFSTPTYKLSLNVHETASYSDESHLISQLPPIATTRANYFRTFATRYAATLLIVFLAMTTMYPLAKFRR